MIPRFRVWMKSLKWMCDVTNISFDSKFVDICQQGDTERYTEMSVEFDEITLMQSTGFFDRNGKEIFDGDVVKCNGLLGTIESFKAMWICSFVKYNNYQKVGFFAREIEVVGNIYENPDLLEDK